jgi:hypothetical protein
MIFKNVKRRNEMLKSVICDEKLSFSMSIVEYNRHISESNENVQQRAYYSFHRFDSRYWWSLFIFFIECNRAECIQIVKSTLFWFQAHSLEISVSNHWDTTDKKCSQTIQRIINLVFSRRESTIILRMRACKQENLLRALSNSRKQASKTSCSRRNQWKSHQKTAIFANSLTM